MIYLGQGATHVVSAWADLSEALWKFFRDAGGFPKTLGVISIILLSVVKLLLFCGRMGFIFVLLLHTALTKMVCSNDDGKKLPRWPALTWLKLNFQNNFGSGWSERQTYVWILFLLPAVKRGDQDPTLLTTPHKELYRENPDLLDPFSFWMCCWFLSTCSR